MIKEFFMDHKHSPIFPIFGLIHKFSLFWTDSQFFPFWADFLLKVFFTSYDLE